MSGAPARPEIAVSLRDVSKRFRLYRGRHVSTVKDLFVRLFVGQGGPGLFSGEELWALRDVSLDLGRGRMVGHRRLERLRQVHAAQGARGHPQADQPARSPCAGGCPP